MRTLADSSMFGGKQSEALAIGSIIAGAGSANLHGRGSIAQIDVVPITLRRGLIENAENLVTIFTRRQASPTAAVDGFAKRVLQI
jgi:hypothetical protein